MKVWLRRQKIVSWIAIGLAIAGILLFVVFPLIIIGIGVSSGEF